MNTNPNVRDTLPAEAESVRRFLDQNGWEHRTGSSEYFAQLVRNSQRTAVALDDQQIIGFARGITDGLSNGYLSMVVVDGEHRRRGIGRALVEHIMGDNPDITWVLRAGREGAAPSPPPPGFETSMIAMERRRLK